MGVGRRRGSAAAADSVVAAASSARAPVAAGLPFGGIPTELHGRGHKLLATEPEHDASHIALHPAAHAKERERLTLPRCSSATTPSASPSGSVLVIVIGLTLQAGPCSSSTPSTRHGATTRPRRVIVVCALLYLAPAVVIVVLPARTGARDRQARRRASCTTCGSASSRTCSD